MFRCEETGCTTAFLSKYGLQKHIKTAHKQSTQGSEQGDNGEGVTEGKQLDKYAVEPEACLGEEFDQVFNEHQHLMTPIADQPQPAIYSCPREGCKRRFPTTSGLKRHLAAHEEYKCDEKGCSATFRRWSSLSKHKAVHHQEKEFIDGKCGICGKVFSKKQWLKQHSRIHGGRRDIFQCPWENCDRTYLDQRNLNTHIRVFHEGQRHRCTDPSCGKDFVSKVSARKLHPEGDDNWSQKLKQHMILMHSPDGEAPKKKVKKDQSVSEKSIEVKGQSSDVHDIEQVLGPGHVEGDVGNL